jgi:hypothetical protein
MEIIVQQEEQVQVVESDPQLMELQDMEEAELIQIHLVEFIVQLEPQQQELVMGKQEMVQESVVDMVNLDKQPQHLVHPMDKLHLQTYLEAERLMDKELLGFLVHLSLEHQGFQEVERHPVNNLHLNYQEVEFHMVKQASPHLVDLQAVLQDIPETMQLELQAQADLHYLEVEFQDYLQVV